MAALSPPETAMAVTSGPFGPTALANPAPHTPQNLSSGWLEAPHFGHARVSAVPQAAQNLRPSRLSLSHLEQRIFPHFGCDGFVH
jgi:hypothetical protein